MITKKLVYFLIVLCSFSCFAFNEDFDKVPKGYCLDESRSVDVSERVEVFEKLVGNVYFSEQDIPFSGLPKEVQHVVQLTSDNLYLKEKFNLYVILSLDPHCKQESVKCYIYTPILDGVLSLDSWRFMVQDGVYKLIDLELNEKLLRK